MDVTPDLTPSLRGTALTMPRTGARAAVAALAAVLLLIAGLPALAAGQGATSVGSYLVEAGSVLPEGARIVRAMPFIDAVIVDSPTPVGAALDTPARPESLIAERFDGLQLDSAVASTGAPQVWSTGERGGRSVVALIDTGVAPVPALDDAVAGEIDFTGSGGGDGYGHGTFMASIIAGRGTVATGVAPEAGILSLKVAADNGETTLGTILSAMQWLDGPGRAAGIRVAALAMAVEPGTQAATFLDRAADRLATHGILVITAAGNDGPGALTSPATSNASFSVGAVDDSTSADRSDDVVAPFSGTGNDGRGVAQPDALASGVDVVGSLPADSVIANSGITPTAEGLYRGSGTSMSTAVAAGVAALANSARPDLDGRVLDQALRAGGGVIDAPASVADALAARGGNGNGNGPGNGNGNGPGNGNGNVNGPGNGSADPQSVRWTSVRWTSVRWTSVRWTSVRWTGEGWGDTTWGAQGWGSVRWTGRTWAYSGAVPQSVRWTSVRWTTVSWGTQP